MTSKQLPVIRIRPLPDRLRYMADKLEEQLPHMHKDGKTMVAGIVTGMRTVAKECEEKAGK